MAFLDNYCMDCHDAETEKGEVNLEDLPFQIGTIEHAERWQDVLAAINSGEMPPKKKKQPKSDEKADFLEDLSNTMVTARQILSDSGGKIVMRRLNKREYQNSIESLVGVQLDENDLPSDGGSGDFDTVGASLFISGDKFEQYLSLGRKAVDEFYAQRAAQNAKPFVMRIEPETIFNPQMDAKMANYDKVRANFTGLKKAVDAFIALPKNKAAVAKISKRQRSSLKSFYKVLATYKGAPNAAKYGFKGGLFGAAKSYEDATTNYGYNKQFADLPNRENGAYLQMPVGYTNIPLAPKRMPLGRYKLRVSAGAVAGSPGYRNFLELGHPTHNVQTRADFVGFALDAMHVKGSVEKPEVIETEFDVHSHTQRSFTIRERRPNNWGQMKKIHYALLRKNGHGHHPAIWIDWVELEGPIAKPQTGKLAKIYAEYRDRDDLSETEMTRAILNAFAKEAFRTNKPKPEFIESMMAVFKNRLRMEKDFDVAIRTPLSVILASPRFIYMNETGTESPRQITDLEAAVRLSHFIWSAPPDAELLKLVEQKRLRNKAVLSQQVERMLQDPKAHTLVAGLAHQWLDMKRLDFFQFSAKEFREFDESFRKESREEVYQTILHLLRSKDGGQLHKLLRSESVVVNAMMATHYGLEGVKGDHYREVALPKKSPRGGLLGMAAIHVMGSDGRESSPVERGAWVLRYLLNDPPPPAPANVPQLSRLAGQKISKKEKLTAHQEEPQCASCHRKIDPIGFGLENFDAIGKWRLTDKHAVSARNRRGVVNASGAFHNGPSFANFFELRDRVYDKKDDFARGFTEALIEYGLGRPYAFTDETLAEEILTAAKAKDYRMDEFVQSLVKTKQFWTK